MPQNGGIRHPSDGLLITRCGLLVLMTTTTTTTTQSDPDRRIHHLALIIIPSSAPFPLFAIHHPHADENQQDEYNHGNGDTGFGARAESAAGTVGAGVGALKGAIVVIAVVIVVIIIIVVIITITKRIQTRASKRPAMGMNRRLSFDFIEVLEFDPKAVKPTTPLYTKR